MENNFKEYDYTCSCGHMIKIFCDSGVPQEKYTCRKCGKVIKRYKVK